MRNGRDGEKPFPFMPTSESISDMTRGVYRRIYSGFTKGQRINKLSLEAEAWFWRVLTTVDDFGNGDADPDLCRDATAGKRQVSSADVARYLGEMWDAKLIEFYEAKGETYLHIVGFEETQPAGKNGRKIRRFPVPDESKGIQGIPDVVSASYSYTHSYTDTDTELVSRSKAPRSTRTARVCDEEYLEGLQASAAYRRLDVRHVYAKMVVWCENRGKQATRARLINWLNREDQPIEIRSATIGRAVEDVELPSLPAGVFKWSCACGFSVIQNGAGVTECPECGGLLTK